MGSVYKSTVPTVVDVRSGFLTNVEGRKFKRTAQGFFVDDAIDETRKKNEQKGEGFSRLWTPRLSDHEFQFSVSPSFAASRHNNTPGHIY